LDSSHLSLETIAKWLSGRLEHDEVRSQVVPHLLSLCPSCTRSYEEVLRLQREMRHWDELISVQESQEAHELFESLTSTPFPEQLRRAEDDDSFHQWGLCQLLLTKSKESLFEEPRRSLELAELAARIARNLGDAYDRDWVRDLRARALAYVANALRVLGELCGADAAFRAAEDCALRSGSGNTLVSAEILDLKSSLRRDQRRWAEALDLCSEAAVLYGENADGRGVAKALFQKAGILFEADEVEAAIDLWRAIPPLLAADSDSDLVSGCRFNLLCCLVQAGRLGEAEELLPEVRSLIPASSPTLKAVHLRWVEGRLDLARGNVALAEVAFREAQNAFLDRRMAYDAALVAMDLAILFAQQERNSELKCLALESMAVFESRQIHREAMATLLLFQEACRDELLTVEMARQLADLLRRDRRQRPSV